MSALPEFSLYKMDISYFSGKMEAYLRNKGIAYTAVTAGARELDLIYKATGVRQVPVIRTADDQWLYDTAAMIDWFESQHPERPILPPDPAEAFLAQLIDDYADEWLWRPAMWWRWEPLPSRRALGRWIAEENNAPGLPKAFVAWFIAQRQRRTWLWGDGVHAGNADGVRDLYLTELDFLQAVFSERPYLLGNQPSLADFGYFASMFRHFGNDPSPAEVMRRHAPKVYDWLSRMWLAEPPSTAAHWQSTDDGHFKPLWQSICGDYLPYLNQNAQAWHDGKKRFDSHGATLSFPGTITHHYRVWCLQRLQRAYAALDETAQRSVQDRLNGFGGIAPLQAESIDSGLDTQYQMPRPAGNYKLKPLLAMFGQARRD